MRKVGVSGSCKRENNMTSIFALLFLYVAGLTLSLLYSIIGEIFVADTSTIILSNAGLIESLIAATFWF
jgi:hypothetical protein